MYKLNVNELTKPVHSEIAALPTFQRASVEPEVLEHPPVRTSLPIKDDNIKIHIAHTGKKLDRQRIEKMFISKLKKGIAL